MRYLKPFTQMKYSLSITTTTNTTTNSVVRVNLMAATTAVSAAWVRQRTKMSTHHTTPHTHAPNIYAKWNFSVDFVWLLAWLLRIEKQATVAIFYSSNIALHILWNRLLYSYLHINYIHYYLYFKQMEWVRTMQWKSALCARMTDGIRLYGCVAVRTLSSVLLSSWVDGARTYKFWRLFGFFFSLFSILFVRRMNDDFE